MLAVPRPKGHVQVRHLLVPVYACSPSGQNCQAWEGVDICVDICVGCMYVNMGKGCVGVCVSTGGGVHT